MKKIAICGATFMALLACSQIQEEDPGVLKTKELTFTAYRAEADTKTERQPGGSVYWNPSDAVSVFFINGDNGGSKFVAQNTEAVATAQFKGTIDVISGGGEGENHEFWFWGVYPYSSENSCDGSSITTVIPKTQEGKAGTFADNTFVTMARSKGLSLGFYNICTGVKFTLTRDDIKEVRIRGNKGEDLAGKVNVEWDANGKPAITQYVDGAKEVAVTAPGGGTFATGTEYYLVLAPTLFTEGFTMSLVTDNEKLGYFVYGNERQFNRGIFINISNLDTRVTSWVDIATKEVPEEGGNVELEVMSSEPCHAVIPEEAQSWISEVPSTKSVEKKTITLKVEPNTGEARSADVTIEQEDGTVLLSYRIEQQTNKEYQLAVEREALIAIYNALDGDNWTNNENWCSDKPVGDWENVHTDSDGYVVSLQLSFIGATGDIPTQIGDLTNLVSLQIGDSEILSIPPQIGNLKKLERLDIGGHQIISIPKEIDNLINLKYLSIWGGKITDVQPNFESFSLLEDVNLNLNGTTDSFPIGLSNCPKLWRIACSGGKFTVFPGFIREMKQLESISFSFADMQNLTIPDWLGEMTNLIYLGLGSCGLVGEIPASLGNLHKLETLTLSRNSLTGTIPASFSDLTRLTELNISDNQLSGKIPYSIIERPWFKYLWGELIDNNQFDLSDLTFYAPEFSVTDINGNQIIAKEIYQANKYTILMNWCPGENISTINAMLQLYNTYKNKGVDMIAWTDTDDRVEVVRPSNTPWHNFLYTHPDNYFYRSSDPYQEILNYPKWYRGLPSIEIVDSESRVVWSNLFSKQTIEDFFAENIVVDWYQSSDYSSDGATTTLQQSTTSNGVDLVFMGDAFSDRQIADGTYANVMQKAADAFFSEEPYKYMKDRFNVYTVNVVSATEGYEHSGQALSTGHGDGTYVYGNDSKVIEYAKKAISEDRLDDAVIIVMMNEDAYAGTCFMYNPPSGNYGRGLSIAYFPTSSDTDTFNGLVSHEAGGHGFAKLADEYAYEYMGAISSDAIANTKVNEAYGWWKNVDFTSDPATVKWSQFLSDPRYASEGLGCFEGGLTYWTGVWRPTDASIMRYNTGGFNAPSRYAIWYRIGKLAYGESWEGSYEDFVAYDAINRTPAAVARRDAQRRRAVQKPLPQLPPPVVVGHSWREELQKGK